MMDQAAITVRQALRRAEAQLSTADTGSAALDARVLLQHVLRWPAAELFLRLNEALRPAQVRLFNILIERRSAGAPVAYLTGHREFYGLDLQVTPDVLIPRPETELLVECAIQSLPNGARVVDVGTGSGAIAIAVAQHRPDIRVLAVDTSLATCRVATANVSQHGLAHRVAIACSDLLSAIRWPVAGVLANLPYLVSAEIPLLAPEVQCEPLSALDGGWDGLDLYRRLFSDLATRCPAPVVVCCEIAPDQSEAMRTLVAEALPQHHIAIVPDLAGRDRLLEARLPMR
ncbi:MAG: peptide chain release factor N(5)-glutamine methyltransferase [Chloroflexota bacterium]